ncbi:hypothetical protein [Pseudomonas brassicacearum]|uniref:hypothetical protein n=1 Tax=Pseudomonas brassicacearum TaxID=930166 RepID=UPI0012975497|nr:hypothetical protein [Pseudomonas brassicacearum]QGA51470.1 hypothetical protein GFU70_20895 [Pseudomonas brassicacearum]
MDNELIDEQILALPRIPAEQSTLKSLIDALQQIAETTDRSAPVQTDGMSDYIDLVLVQREQLKLCAIGVFLMEEYGYTWCSVTNSSDVSNDDRHITLSIILTSDQDHFLIGYGNTAEKALRDLHKVKRTPPRTAE